MRNDTTPIVRSKQAYFSFSKDISQYIFRSWGVDEGFPSPTVNAIVQSAEGYIWAATFEGLVRFDGNRAKVFSERNTKELTVPGVISLAADSSSVWIGTYGGGLLRYHNERFSVVPLDTALGKIIISVFPWQQGEAVICTEKGTALIAPNGNIRSLPFSKEFSSETIDFLYVDSRERIWLISRRKELFLLTKNALYRTTLPSAPYRMNLQSVMAEQADGSLYIAAATGGLLQVQLSNDSLHLERLLPDVPIVSSVFADADKTLWLYAGNELIRYQQATATLLSRYDARHFGTVTSWWQDKKKRLWLGTFYAGLQSIEDGKFFLLRESEGLPSNLSYCAAELPSGIRALGTERGVALLESTRQHKNSMRLLTDFSTRVRALIALAPDSLLIGTEAGLYLENIRTGKRQRVTTAQGLPSDYISALYVDDKKNLWIGTNIGLAILPKGHKTCSVLPALSGQFILSITADSSGVMWIGTSDNGVFQLTPTSTGYNSGKQLLSGRAVFNLRSTSAGMWAATNQGLLLYTADSVYTVTASEGLPTNTVFDISPPVAGMYWLITGKGIASVPANDLLEHIRAKNKRLETFRLYTKADGLQTTSCTPLGKILVTGNKQVIFPTLGGFVLYNPQNFTGISTPPQTYIEHIIADTTGVGRNDEGHFIIPQGSKTIEIKFAGLHYAPAENTVFECQLQGFDERSYMLEGAINSVYYTNLVPGEYTFKVRARDEDGLWSKQYAVAKLIVQPFFWQTLVFKVSVFLITLSVLAFVFRWRLLLLKKKAAELELAVRNRTLELEQSNARLQEANTQIASQLIRLDEQAKNIEQTNNALTEKNTLLQQYIKQKDEFLGIAAHDLKNPLTHILLAVEAIERYSNKMSARQIRESLLRVKETITTMRNIIANLLSVNELESEDFSLPLSSVAVAQAVQKVVGNYTTVAEKKNIALQYHINSAFSTVSVIANQEAFTEILDNLISNAIKYSPFNTTITIDWYVASGQIVEFRIKDEGPGISEEDQKKLFQRFTRLSARPTAGENSTGLGLSIVKRYAELMHGTIHCESTLGAGATFILRLPLSQS